MVGAIARRAAAGWDRERSPRRSCRRDAAAQGRRVVVERDEGIRADSTAEALAKLKPAFKQDGTITAGNASQISDGAAAVVVRSPEDSPSSSGSSRSPRSSRTG